MNFDTTHEYYLDDPSFYYCEDHKSLMIHTNEGRIDNRLVLHGVQLDALVELSKHIIELTTKDKPKKPTRKTVTTD